MNETAITLAGNLVADPELRYTPQGTAVANFRVASTARLKGTDGWQDGDTLFLTVNAWRDLAEHVAETARKGDRVIVTGRLRQRSYDGQGGGKVTVTEIEASDVGCPSSGSPPGWPRPSGTAAAVMPRRNPLSRRRPGGAVLHPVR